MIQAIKVKTKAKSRFLISIGECGGKPTTLNVNYVETIQLDGEEYVFTMKSGKVYRVKKDDQLTKWLLPFVVGANN